MKCSLGSSNFLEVISSFSHSIVSLYFFALDLSQKAKKQLFSSISLYWSPRKAFLSLLASLWNSAFKWVYLSFYPLPFTSLLFTTIFKASSDNHLPFCIFSGLGGWSWFLPPVQCHEPPPIVLQALCLSDLIPLIYFSLPLYNHKGFDLGHTWMV